MATEPTDSPTTYLETAASHVDSARDALGSESEVAADLDGLRADLDELIERVADDGETDGDDDAEDSFRIPSPGGLRGL